MRQRNSSLLLSLLVSGSLILTACGGDNGAAPTTAPAGGGAATSAPGAATSAPAASGGSSSGGVTIRYALWDSNQQPAYQKCADAFHAANPNITVKIEQSGWNDYWSGIQTGMVGATAPDVFTDHLAKYPEFANKGQ